MFPDLDMFSTLLMKPEPMPTMDSIREEHHQYHSDDGNDGLDLLCRKSRRTTPSPQRR